ncbi:chloride conductance regulatory protein ICln-like [Primulina huaijiensis]|uniref:chloride conductance regulatory protein ICln-like n=1 Tax=Primulina huaijiensis TaxID=1492673 RepID=UPI003CC731C2
MAAGLRLVAERAGEDAGQPVFDEDNGEELMHTQPGVSIVLGNRPPEFPGTLYISTKQVVWLSDTDRAKGYAVDIVSVALHAVSRDPEAYPSPCIYAQIETGAEDDEMDDSDSETNEILDLSKITEMRLVPSDPNQVDTLFAVFCECAELNPDPIEDEEDGHNWNFSAAQFENEGLDDEDSEWNISQNSTRTIGANGDNDLCHSVVQLQINDQRFEDAEESEQSDKNGHH